MKALWTIKTSETTVKTFVLKRDSNTFQMKAKYVQLRYVQNTAISSNELLAVVYFIKSFGTA